MSVKVKERKCRISHSGSLVACEFTKVETSDLSMGTVKLKSHIALKKL